MTEDVGVAGPLGICSKSARARTMSAAARNGADKDAVSCEPRTSCGTRSTCRPSTRCRSRPTNCLAKLLKRGDLLVCEGGEIGRGRDLARRCRNDVVPEPPAPASADCPRTSSRASTCSSCNPLSPNSASSKGPPTRPRSRICPRSRLAGLEVPYPSMGEQEAISAALGRLRDAIHVPGSEPDRCAGPQARGHAHPLHPRPCEASRRRRRRSGRCRRVGERTTLGNLCEAPGGALQTGPFGSQLHKDDYQDTGTPVVNPTHLADLRVDHAGVPRISEHDAQRLERHRPRTG